MFAVRIDRYGPPQSLYFGDAPMPTPGPYDVLVRVRAVGVNRLDLLLREGEVFCIAGLVEQCLFGKIVLTV